MEPKDTDVVFEAVLQGMLGYTYGPVPLGDLLKKLPRHQKWWWRTTQSKNSVAEILAATYEKEQAALVCFGRTAGDNVYMHLIWGVNDPTYTFSRTND